MPAPRPDPPALSVVAFDVGYGVVCSVHGILPARWSSEDFAGFDLLGHAAHAHPCPPATDRG